MGYKEIVIGHDKNELSSMYDIYVLQQKSITLLKAYIIAMKYMPKLTWEQCCIKAIEKLSPIGIQLAKNPRIIMKRNMFF